MMSLGAAKLLGILLETLGYGEHSVSVLVPYTCPHHLLPRLATKGIFLVMFVCNTYLQTRNLSDRNSMRPNVFLLVCSTLLFVLTTSVSPPFPKAPDPQPLSHAFAIPAVGYRGREDLRGRRAFGGSD